MEHNETFSEKVVPFTVRMLQTKIHIKFRQTRLFSCLIVQMANAIDTQTEFTSFELSLPLGQTVKRGFCPCK